MRRKTATLRTVFVVALTAALAGACWAGSARHAAAFFRMGGGHFGGARISGHSSGGRYGVRMHGGDRISHGRHRAELPSRGSEGRGGRGPAGTFPTVGLLDTAMATATAAVSVCGPQVVAAAADLAAVAASVVCRRPVNGGSCPMRWWWNSIRASRRKRSPALPAYSI